MKYRLLFVDDEARILEGIRDSLRKHRKQWDMSFVCGGEAAIVELEEKSFDVVICDMRMPVVDGVDVLTYAKQKCPSTIRIVLSGYSEIEHTVRVSSLAHRYLTKPCDLEELEATIRHSLELSEKLNDDNIKMIAGTVGLLPTCEPNHQMLLGVIKRGDTSIAEIAQIIESDIALTAKVLHLVNSAFFRRQRKIESAREATAYLGLDLIRSIALAEQLCFQPVISESINMEWIDRLQKHSWLTALIAKHLMCDTCYEEAAFTAALLHEIGALVLGIEQPNTRNTTKEIDADSFKIVDNTPAESGTDIQDQLGAYLMNLWGIPFTIVEAIAFYKKPSALARDEFDAVGAVHVANHLAEVCMSGDYQLQLGDNLDIEYLKALNLEDQLDDWMLSAQLIESDIETGIASPHFIRAA